MFNPAIDSTLRGCDIKSENVAPSGGNLTLGTHDASAFGALRKRIDGRS
jgi:hypothetical protein